ncbi:hypothetical protein [Pedobacter sp. JY14-1]|uniref:hypothetical protein n=1 Tax=Pedobacter sp. JY14-1 TaxID=3034151 RepID=UPI0023E1FF47|nr:hypothetical protein [Pedobacter sp. JY14-1]
MNDSVRGVFPHVLNHVIFELCRNGFILAFEKGLSDLKGLVPADSMDEDDFELLESVNDPVVNLLLASIEKVIRCAKTYYMINNLDELEIMENEEYNELASDSFYIYIMEWDSKSYEDVLFNLNIVYLSISQLLYHMSRQIELDSIEVPEEIYEEFLAKSDELLNGTLPADDKNVRLLYDLIISLNEDLLEIDKITRK